jgi:virginiamycin B lyase
MLKVMVVIALATLCVSRVSADQDVAHETVAGYFREYPLDHPGSGPAIVTVDEDDNVWTALARSGRLARFSNGGVALFDIGPQSRPVGVAAGSRANGQAGMIWIAASYDNKIIRFDPRSGEKKEFTIDGSPSWPFNISLDNRGHVWFSQRASGRVGRLDPTSGGIQHYQPPTVDGGVAGLAIDAASGRVWFTEAYKDRIGVIEPGTGTVREYVMGEQSTGLVSGPAGIAIDAQGGVWFAKLEGKLGHLPAGSERLELIDVPAAAGRPAGIAVAGNGDVWMLALDGNMVVRYRPTRRRFTMYPIPTGTADTGPSAPPGARTSRPFGLAFDRQGNLWFSQQYTGQLGVLDVAPPEVAIISPSTTLRMPDPLLLVQTYDRVGGVTKVSASVDGEPAQVSQGRLDLTSIRPGDHELEVRADDAAGNTATARRVFEYAPDTNGFVTMLRRLAPPRVEDSSLWAALLREVDALLTDDPRPALERMTALLASVDGEGFGRAREHLRAAVDYQLRVAAKTVVIEVLGVMPYFSLSHVMIRVGETIRWEHRPNPDAHAGAHELAQLEIGGSAERSPRLRAGETFSFRFDRPGDFIVRNLMQTGAVATVKVQP